MSTNSDDGNYGITCKRLGKRRLSSIFSLLKAASLFCLMLHLRQVAIDVSGRLAFEGQMLTLLIVGYTLPLIVMACFILAEGMIGQGNSNR